MSTFEGIPSAAFRFYEELEENNNREWWLEHKDTYDAAVKEPLAALLSELEPEFGPAKIFRPYRDTRFSKDKTPYKTNLGATTRAKLQVERATASKERSSGCRCSTGRTAAHRR